MQTNENEQIALAFRAQFIELLTGYEPQVLSALQQTFSLREDLWFEELELIQAELTRRKEQSYQPQVLRLTGRDCASPYADDYHPTAS